MASISESFNTGDSTTLGPDLTWTEVRGDWEIASNHAFATQNGIAPWYLAQSVTEMGTDDHYAEIELGSNRGFSIGVTVRGNNSDSECYVFYVANNGVNDYLIIAYMSPGGTAMTVLASIALDSFLGSGDVLRLRAWSDGLSGYVNGRQMLHANSTAITTGKRVGMHCYASTADGDINSFAAADFSVSSADEISDDFNVPDSYIIGSDLDWTQHEPGFGIGGNLIVPYLVGARMMYSETALNSDDMIVTVEVGSQTWSPIQGLAARVSPGGNEYYYAYFNAVGPEWYMYRYDDRVNTLIASDTSGTGPTPNSGDTIKLVVCGSLLRVYLNSTKVLQAEDSNISGNYHAGIWSNQSASQSEFDNFYAGSEIIGEVFGRVNGGLIR